MILKLEKFKRKEIDAINKVVERGVAFEVDDELGKKLVQTKMYREVKPLKKKGDE